MMNKSIKDAIDARLSGIKYVPTAEAYSSAKCCSHHDKAVTFRRAVCIAAACCVVLTFSVGVMATNIPSLNNLFAIIGTRISNMVQPIVQECSSADIRMEVLAAMNDDDAVVVYLTLQDIKGMHVDASTELYDMEIEGISFPHTEVINYDAASHTATMRVTGTGGKALNGQKIGIKLNTILTGKTESYNVDTGYTAADIVGDNEAKPIFYPENISEYSGNEYYDVIAREIKRKNFPVLKPNLATAKPADVPWTYISAFGKINDTLRIQQNPDDEMGRYNSLSFALADRQGQILNDMPEGSVSFGEVHEDKLNRYTDYQEQIFKLPEGMALSDIKLMASTVSFAEKISGEWKTSFVLNSVTEQKSADCIINMNPWEVTKVIVSPIGVTVKGHGQMFDYSQTPDITARRLDGTTIEFNSSSVSVSDENGEEVIIYKNAFSIPVDINEISSVSINGIDISIK